METKNGGAAPVALPGKNERSRSNLGTPSLVPGLRTARPSVKMKNLPALKPSAFRELRKKVGGFIANIFTWCLP